jgi:hypothetical protein
MGAGPLSQSEAISDLPCISMPYQILILVGSDHAQCVTGKVLLCVEIVVKMIQVQSAIEAYTVASGC